MIENQENKNLVIYQNSNLSLQNANNNENVKLNIEIKNGDDIKKLWKNLSEEIKKVDSLLLNPNERQKIKFRLHNHNFNVNIPFIGKKINDSNQKLILMLICIIPILFMILVILLVNLLPSISQDVAISITILSNILAFGAIVVGFLLKWKINKNAKKLIIDSQETINNIESIFQKITLIKKDGIFEKEYLGFKPNDLFEDIKLKINEDWIFERRKDLLRNNQDLIEKINIFFVELEKTNDPNYLLVTFKVKERKVKTLKKTTNEIIVEKNREPIKFEFLILL